MATDNKKINDSIRTKAGRKVSKIQKTKSEPNKNKGVNDMIRKKSGRR